MIPVITITIAVGSEGATVSTQPGGAIVAQSESALPSPMDLVIPQGPSTGAAADPPSPTEVPIGVQPELGVADAGLPTPMDAVPPVSEDGPMVQGPSPTLVEGIDHGSLALGGPEPMSLEELRKKFG